MRVARDCNIGHLNQRVRFLQSDWNSEKVRSIASNDLSKLANPFLKLRANKFVTLKYQDAPVVIPSLDPESLSFADAVCEATYDYDNKEQPHLRVHVDYAQYKKKNPLTT